MSEENKNENENENQYGHYIACDFELIGPAPQGPIIEMGYVIGSMNPKRMDIKESGSWSFKYNIKEKMHPETLKFWQKNNHMDILEDIQKDAIDPGIVWSHILKWRNYLETRYGSNLVWLSDNPLFDLGAIDFELATRFLRHSIRYNQDGTIYQFVQDPSEQWAGLPSFVKPQLSRQLNDLMSHSALVNDPEKNLQPHRGEYDALHIFYQQKVIDQWQQKYNQKQNWFSWWWNYLLA